MKSKKINVALNISIIFIALAIVLYFALKDNFKEIINLVLNMNIWYVLLAFLVVIIYRTIIGVSSYFVTIGNGCKFKLLRSIQINFIILFFHGITPFAGGGQPMEIYYLHNDKVSKTRATNITIQNFIIYQTALLIVEIFAIIYNHLFGLFPRNSIITNLVLLGMLVNFCVWFVVFSLAFFKKLDDFLLKIGIKLLAKLRIVKDLDNAKRKLDDFIDNFHDNALELREKKLMLLKCISLNVIALLCLYSLPFFIIKGMGFIDINFFTMLVTTTYVMVIGAFVPIPGGTGGLEYGFMSFFGYFIGGGMLSAIMLVWRFISYYFGVILGAICLAVYKKKEDEE